MKQEFRRFPTAEKTSSVETAEAKSATFKLGFCRICSANWEKLNIKKNKNKNQLHCELQMSVMHMQRAGKVGD